MTAATVYPLSVVRALALHTQGLAAPVEFGTIPQGAKVLEVAELLGGLQIDTLQRVQRSHYLTVWSRLGRFDPYDLDRLAYGEEGRRLFEYWFHGVSLIPLTEYRHRLPMMRWFRD
ncbi:MAG: winged helix-turn-helix domain-containing protein, partial [Anaerolineales bacterium]|nr:winged helix-turn-helix domain-containing protein [Anaerolineales bacterium]